MRILIIGGTGFIGSFVVRHLSALGHEITVFHRGQTKSDLPPTVNYFLGDRQNLSHMSTFKRLAPQVVLDITPLTEQDAQAVMATFKGIARRVVALSSGDVYRAYGVLIGIEPGSIEPVPLAEDAPLRRTLYPYRSQSEGQGDLRYDYEKILVEQVVMSDPDLPGTILRLPMVYGKQDTKHRLFSYLKRMDDKRPAILLEEGQANWRWTKGYVENVAAAIALAVTDEHSTGRIYNVGDAETVCEAEWIRQIGQVAGWNGDIVTVPRGYLPAVDGNLEQDLVVDTARIREELGYKEPVPQDEALRQTIDWERTHPPNQISLEMFDYATEDAILANLEQL